MTTDRQTTYKPPKDEAQAERRRAYNREYRRTHPDKVKAWNKTFYLRQAAKAINEIAAREGDAE